MTAAKNKDFAQGCTERKVPFRFLCRLCVFARRNTNYYIRTRIARSAEQDGWGLVSGPDGSFLFPNGARRQPDAAWFNAARWKAAKASAPGTRVPVFAPEFVIEVRSPEQRIRMQREKMQEYVANGVLLGWLIDPVDRTVTVYRPGRAPEILSNPVTASGEGPVAGFVLDLERVFAG
ncbi:MAG: Uma2 family endonuclease [Bryobacterales bacterium]|nr:Uma2 family endonuclease [Bryobacterales bacterium]MBV9398601.1 Uma2 family endonuclease [Bryobacterales bacterium]